MLDRGGQVEDEKNECCGQNKAGEDDHRSVSSWMRRRSSSIEEAFTPSGMATAGTAGRCFQARTIPIVSRMPPLNAANGMIQAMRLKPVVVGAARTVVPYFCTKAWRMSSSLSQSFSPAVSSFRMRSLYVQPT